MGESHAADERSRKLCTEKQNYNSSKKEETGKRKGRTSWIGVVFGWLAALGTELVLDSLLNETPIIEVLGRNEGQYEIVWLLVMITVAFLIGGYVAGRMAGHYGLKHGLMVAFLSLILTITLGLFRLVTGADLADNLDGVVLPERLDARQSLEALLLPSGVLALALPFLGAAFGGVWGVKAGRERP